MKKRKIGMRIMAMLLAIMMMVPMSLLEVAADTVGQLRNQETNMTLDTSNIITLPVKIYDYLNDGMLFEYAETVISQSETNYWLRKENVSKPTASIITDYTKGSTGYSAIKYSSGTYVSGAASKGNTSTLTYLNWPKNMDSVCLSVFDLATEGHSAISYAVSKIRYLTLVYRATNGTAADTAEFDMWNNTDSVRSSRVSVKYDNRGSDWRYMIVDLNKTNVDLTDYVTAVYGYMPKGTGVAYAAYFDDQAKADVFGKSALEYVGQMYHDLGDNRAFGFLRASRNGSYADTDSNVNLGTTFSGSSVASSNGIYLANSYNKGNLDLSKIPSSSLGYQMLGTFGEDGIAAVGMLENSLSAMGYPVYKESSVTYLAKLLKNSLEIPEIDSATGYHNYSFVKGATSNKYGNKDLAAWLRDNISGMGSYAESKNKNLVGTWEECSGNIKTYYDAAYFLLNSIFIAGSYNTPKGDYDYLVLSQATRPDNTTTYVFDGGFADSATAASAKSAVKYDTDKRTISNTSSAGKTEYAYEVSDDGTGRYTTYYPFLPVTDGNNSTGQTYSPYFLDPGVASKDANGNTYKNRNYSYAMVSNGEFVYHADDELYFTFEGDDDVYLFINGELVLDIGGAHSITRETIKVNDYVNAAKAGTLGSDVRNKALALEEGNTYDFDFYYMERHGVGANMRIETNIRVTDPSMTTTKTAWQDGTALDFGSIVDKDKVVEYGFGITNNGKENLYNLTFTDANIGVNLNPTDGLKVTGSRVYDVNGERLEASDLTAVVSHPNYADIHVTFANNDALKTFLKDLTAAGTEAGGGLFEKASVQIRGIGYRLNDDQIKAGVFDNTVLTTSTNKTESKTLQGQASMRVFVPADPMYYEWVGHDLKVSKTELITDVLAAANTQGNILAGKVPNLTTGNVNKMELVTKAGTAVTSPYVTVDGSYNLTINYPTAGSKVFYVKVTYNSSKNTVIVPVLVNVTAVKDSVYVLDYGLKVDLTDNNALTKNDTLTVPGRATAYSVLGIGTNGAYNPNEITFTTSNEVASDAGKFEYNNGTVTYTPNDFMEGLDTVQVAVNVYESDITPSKITGTLNINKEVEMYKNISVIPANVVYYEDDFPAITYKDGNSATAGSFVAIGTEQSNKQDQEYGQDEAYQNNSDMSGGSLKTIAISDSSTVASFKFKGTGFELIGRTNASDSATIILKVKDSTGKAVKTIPVITEFDNNDDGGSEEIYQVPVVRVNDLAYAEYTVEISGVPANEYDDAGNKIGTKTTYLYVDGLRIFQPMGASNDNYKPEENGATFAEIRDLILEGYAAAAEWTDDYLNVSTKLVTWTENLDGEYVGNQVASADDYLIKGPNNEVYEMGSYNDSAIVFYVQEDGSKVHNLQVAVRKIDEGLFTGTVALADAETPIVSYGTLTNGEYGWTELATVNSGTEQYYTIDYKQCPYVEGRGYQVVLHISNAEGMVSYTSLKYKGLTIGSQAAGADGELTKLYYVNGVLTGERADGTTVGISEATATAFNVLHDQVMVSSESTKPNTPVVPDKPEDDTTEDEKPEDGTTEDVKPEDGTTEAPETDKPEQNKPSSSNNWWDKLFGNWWGNKDDEEEDKPASTEKPEDDTTEDVKPEDGTTEDVKPEDGTTEAPGNNNNNSGSNGIFGWLTGIFGKWFK